MENLPESLDVDYTSDASTSNNAPLRSTEATRFAEAQSFSTAARVEIEQLIKLINQPQTRTVAIVQLNKERGPELGLLLWYSRDTTFSLLQELFLGYKLLSPPRLSMAESTRICNALALIQCMASHPEARMGLIKAEIPLYFYPFIHTSGQQLGHFEYLRVSCLGVIGALVKEEGPNTQEIVHYLLKIETVPLCLRCMDVGHDLTKTVAALILSKILEQHEGKIYCGSFIERFFVVSKALSKMVDEFQGKPSAALLKNILICYLRLSEVSRCCDVLRECYPKKLRDLAYLNYVCDESTRDLAHQVLQNIMARQQPVSLENLLAGLKI